MMFLGQKISLKLSVSRVAGTARGVMGPSDVMPQLSQRRALSAFTGRRGGNEAGFKVVNAT